MCIRDRLRRLVGWGIDLVDCQVRTDHLARFGAEDWPRTRFLEALAGALSAPTRRGSWATSIAGSSTGPGAAVGDPPTHGEGPEVSAPAARVVREGG